MKSKKRVVLMSIGVVLVIAIAAVALLGRQYYNDRYVGTDYYARVPLDYDMTPQMKYTSDHIEMGLAMDYLLVAYSEQGEAREVEFDLFEEGSGWANSGPYPQPGTYLLIKASSELVVGWDYCERANIPPQALAAIEGS